MKQTDEHDLLQHIRYSVLLFFGWTILIVILSYSIPIYLLQEYDRVYDQALIIGCLSLPLLWLVYRKKLETARWLFLINGSIIVLIIFYRWGEQGIDSHIEMQYIGLALLIMLLFDEYLPWVITVIYGLLIIGMRVIISYWLDVKFLTTDVYSEILNLSFVSYAGYAAKTAALKVQQKTINQNSQLVQQNIELEKLNAFKDKLFNIISHDIRNPVATLKLMLNSTDPSIDEASQLRSAKQMVNESYIVIDNLLHWSRLQHNEFKIYPSECDLVEITEGVIALFNDLILYKKVNLIVNFRHTICTSDEYIAEIVVRNILQNAIKFTPTNGQIMIYIRYEKDKAVITIKDTGIGMNPDSLPFGMKRPLISMKGTYGENGTGLGLGICYELMEKLNGRIVIDSKPNSGTTVKIIF